MGKKNCTEKKLSLRFGDTIKNKVPFPGDPKSWSSFFSPVRNEEKKLPNWPGGKGRCIFWPSSYFKSIFGWLLKSVNYFCGENYVLPPHPVEAAIMFPVDEDDKRAHSSWTTCPLIQSPLSWPGPLQYPPWHAPRPLSSIGVRTDLWAGCWGQMHSRDIHSIGGEVVWEVGSLEGLHQWGSCCPEIWVWC